MKPLENVYSESLITKLTPALPQDLLSEQNTNFVSDDASPMQTHDSHISDHQITDSEDTVNFNEVDEEKPSICLEDDDSLASWVYEEFAKGKDLET